MIKITLLMIINIAYWGFSEWYRSGDIVYGLICGIGFTFACATTGFFVGHVISKAKFRK